MGVHATYCQLCGLPTQHDHYVRAPERRMMKIYRGGEPDGGHEWEPGDRPFAFTPAHAWLRRAVALSFDGETTWHGTVCDGAIETEDGDGDYVGSGDDDALVFHEACWVALGRPATDGAARTSSGRHAFALVSPYQEQLFEFAALVADGKGWMLEDPAGGAQMRAHLDGLVAAARARDAEEPATLADLLARDDDWSGVTKRGPDFGRVAVVRRREGVWDVDRAGFGDLIWVQKEYAPAPEAWTQLEALEVALKADAESDGGALLVLSLISADYAELLFYARDAEATLQRLEKRADIDVVASAMLGTKPDPEWAELAERAGRPG